MAKAKYRVQQVRIEGFRGFTHPQSIEIDGKNLFVFGPNGRGKSSIVEAIRWCLFGAPPGGDIEVRNTFYGPQECRVSLTLRGSEGALTVNREFRPGQDRSRQLIRDSSGKEILARDALPQLARLGHHESAQVIFAAQHAAGRQVPADISDFKTVLCFYLRLEDVPKLLDALRSLQEERTGESERLSASVEQIEHGYKERIKQIEALLAGIRANPPWGEAEAPTGNETDEKIKLFALQAGRLVGQELPADADSPRLLTQAQQWIEAAAAQERMARESRRTTLRSQIAQADALIATTKQNAAEKQLLDQKLLQAQGNLKAILDAESEASVRERLEALERAKSENDTRLMIAQAARELVNKYPTEECPVCGKHHAAADLQLAIASQCQSSGRDVSAIEQLRNTVARIDQLKRELETLGQQVEATKKKHADAMSKLSALLGVDVSQLEVEEVVKRVAEFKSDLEALNQQLTEAESSRQKQLRKIKDLQQELKYHEYRDSLKGLQAKLAEGMNDARQLLRDYRNLLARVEEIRSLIDQAFKDALNRAIPVLDDEFTLVFTRLTQQLSYDLVRIHHDPQRTGNLELRVASTGLRDQTFPANVLNGQAYKALHLVPYFVFSRLQSEVMELDLLLVDDPSESFDTSHVELLVQELAQAARHAQLVVASHEKEKFIPYLEKHLQADPFAVIAVDHFDRNNGPRVEPARL